MVKKRVYRDRKIISNRPRQPTGFGYLTNYLQHGVGWSGSQIRKKYHKTKRDGKAYFPKVNFIRYADDFIVTGESRELLKQVFSRLSGNFYQREDWNCQKKKTVITHIEDGFDFLGCNIRWYKESFLQKPSKKNYKAIVNKIRGL